MAVVPTRYVVHPEEADMHPSTDTARLEQLVTTMSERLAALTRTLGT